MPKITDQHIKPTPFQKMKVKLAAQLLSNSVAVALGTYISLGIFPASATAIAEFIEKMDNLFDIMNSQNIHSTKIFKQSFTGKNHQLQFLNDILIVFANMKILKNNVNITKRVKFIEGWKQTINGVLSMRIYLKKEGVTNLYTRRLDQDGLENLFGKIRQQNGNCRNPTANQFAASYKKLFCLNYMNNSAGANCFGDFDEMLLSLRASNGDKLQVLFQESTAHIPLNVDTTDYRNLNITEQNAFVYICGYLIKKCLVKHECETCTTYAREGTDLAEENLYSYFKAYEHESGTFGKLCMPQNSFFIWYM